MRGIDTQVRKVRRRVFKEVANLAYHSENLIDDMEALPYKIIDTENPYWESIYRERAVVRERIRLAMGMSPCVKTNQCMSHREWRKVIFPINIMNHH